MHFSGIFFQCSNVKCRCQYYRSLYVIQMPLEVLTPTYHAFGMFYWTDDHHLDDPHNLIILTILIISIISMRSSPVLDDLDDLNNLDEIIPCSRWSSHLFRFPSDGSRISISLGRGTVTEVYFCIKPSLLGEGIYSRRKRWSCTVISRPHLM